MRKALFALAAAAALTAGCGGGNGPAQHAGSPAPLHNPLDFPLYSNASIISTKSFTQVVRASSGSGSSAFAQGNGTYNGHEVIASSSAQFSALSAWLDTVNASPPDGYAAVEPDSNAEQAQAQRYGLDYAAFKKKSGTSTRGLLVIVMDPQRVNKRFGTILGMIDRYKALPEMLRAPIDKEAKARFGMTISQATQPDSPIGAALAALDELEHKNARGIVMIDAQKQ